MLADGVGDLAVREGNEVRPVFVAEADENGAVISLAARDAAAAGDGYVAWPRADGVRIVPFSAIDFDSLPPASLRLQEAASAPPPVEGD